MENAPRTRWDDLLDALADEVAQRLRAPAPENPPTPEKIEPAALEPEPEPVISQPASAENAFVVEEPVAPPPDFSRPLGASRLIQRLMIGVLLMVVLINVPLNRYGTSLARSLPSSSSLVIRDGLLVKEDGSDDVYVFRNDEFHWISSLVAFEHYRYRWSQVHSVETGFLNNFQLGKPIHILLKCEDSPHIYRLENDKKRWIRDIATFEEEGHTWDDVSFMACDALRAIPNGESIPPDSGPVPQP